LAPVIHQQMSIDDDDFGDDWSDSRLQKNRT